MLDSIKIGHFISEKRKELKMTQQQLADKLKVSFQAVSKRKRLPQSGGSL